MGGAVEVADRHACDGAVQVRRTLENVPTMLAPRYWGAHLLAVVLVAAALWLGFWQLDAWQAHRAAEAADLTHAEAQPIDDVIGPDDPSRETWSGSRSSCPAPGCLSPRSTSPDARRTVVRATGW